MQALDSSRMYLALEYGILTPFSCSTVLAASIALTPSNTSSGPAVLN